MVPNRRNCGIAAANGFGAFRLDVEAGAPFRGAEPIAPGAGPRSCFACGQNGPWVPKNAPPGGLAWLSVESDSMRLGLSFDGASYVKEMAEAKAKRGKFVFPGRDPGEPLSDMAMFMLLRDMCPSEKVTVHGFRSSFRDWA